MRSLERIRKFTEIIEKQLESSETAETAIKIMKSEEIDARLIEAKDKFLEFMDNDFNTPYALRAVFELVRDINRRINEQNISKRDLVNIKELFGEFGNILGISFFFEEKESVKKTDELTERLLELLIEVRQELRNKKDWKMADEIRSRMKAMNIVLEDTKADERKL